MAFQFFTQIPGAVALVHTRGTYRQADLYARGERIYARIGAGFIRLGIGGATSAPTTRWAEYDAGDSATITEAPGTEPRLVSMGDDTAANVAKVMEAAE